MPYHQFSISFLPVIYQKHKKAVRNHTETWLLLILVRTDLIMVLRNQVLLNQFGISGYSKTMSDFYICGQSALYYKNTNKKIAQLWFIWSLNYNYILVTIIAISFIILYNQKAWGRRAKVFVFQRGKTF